MAHIIVTGTSGTLGRAVTAELQARGHDVLGIDLAPAAHDALQIGGVDLADEVAITAAFAQGVATLGGLDGLVNVAGGFTWETLAQGSIDSWDAMYRINVRTAALAVRAALLHLRRPGGAIVNVGAAAAAQAVTGMGPYAASKAGVLALTQSLADELRVEGVRVNAVLPTILDTPANRRDMPDADPAQWVSPEAAARTIAFLLSDDAAAVTGAGVVLSMGQGG